MEIVENIPVPPSRNDYVRMAKKLKVGTCVLVGKKEAASLRSAIVKMYGKGSSVSRKAPDPDKKYVWRVDPNRDVAQEPVTEKVEPAQEIPQPIGNQYV